MRRALWPVVLACAGACTDPPPASDPNAGLLRDFVDGKFDAAGHPVNAKILEAEAICPQLATGDGAIALADSAACEAPLPEGARVGPLTANVRLRVLAHPDRGAIASISLATDGGERIVETLTVSRLRDRDGWVDLPVSFDSGVATTLRLAAAHGARIEVDYVEVFPRRIRLAISPGSGMFAPTDRVTFEVPRNHKLDRLEVDGVDVRSRLDTLVSQHLATKTTTTLRTLYDVAVGDLVQTHGSISELRAWAGDDAARIELRSAPPACNFQGAADGKAVLVTGFQPFPADGWHENVSAVAIGALDPASVRGARVMRLVLPVEYDRAAAEVSDAIERCAPDIVISFGQGGDAIALEHTAYNLQDTGELAGGAPDNRGIIRSAQPIDDTAPATRTSLLPLAAIRASIEALGEQPEDSTDPGRYICNNVMFADIAAMTARGGVGGFIHLPYTTSFDDATRARFGKVVAAAIQATVDAN